MYKLCSEQLSQQDHYDYGMRQVKSVLVMAGGQKRANPDLHENISLIRAMLEANVPRFLADDLPLFEGIIGDLYPNLEIPAVDYGALKSACEDALARGGCRSSAALRRQDDRALPDAQRALRRDDSSARRAAASLLPARAADGDDVRSSAAGHDPDPAMAARTCTRTSSTRSASRWASCTASSTRSRRSGPTASPLR